MGTSHRLFLSGFFGFANIGDEGLLHAMLRGFRAQDPELRFHVLCGDPAGFANELDVTSIDWRDPVAVMDALDASDAVVFTGGLLHDSIDASGEPLFLPATGGIALHAGSAIYASLTGRNSILLAVGAGPLQSTYSNLLAKRICELSSFVSVRDEGSKRALEGAGVDPSGVHVACDLIFAYPPEPERCEFLDEFLGERLGSPAGGRRLGLALRSWSRGVDPEYWETQVAQAVDEWIAVSQGNAIFLPMQTAKGNEDDRLVAERIMARMKRSTQSSRGRAWSVDRCLTPGQMRWALGQCDLVLGMRYHAVAFAALNGTPFVSLSYDPKVRSLAGQLKLAHLDAALATIQSAQLTNLMAGAEAMAQEIREHLASAVMPCRGQALAVFPAAYRAIRRIAAKSESDAILAESLRSQAGRIRFVEAQRISLEAHCTRLEAQCATLEEERAILEAVRVAAYTERELLEGEFRILHAWSLAQGEHIKALIADVGEAQRAAEARNRFLPRLDRAAIRKQIHSVLDMVQKLTPGILRRWIRPLYLVVYRSIFPVGPWEFQEAKPACETAATLEPSPVGRRTSQSQKISGWPVGINPLVSIVLPVRNQPGLLAESIRSILNQTYRNLELIVVDDGSTADLVPVLKAFGPDSRLRCMRRAHAGLPRTLSAGFRMARGEFWTWTSADNIAHPEMIETLLSFLLRRPDVDMTFGNMDLIDDHGAPLLHSDYRIHAQRPGATNELDLPRTVETLGLINDNFIGACFLYRAEMGRALGDYDAFLLGTEDYDYWLRMQSAARIEHVDSRKCLYSYRVHDNSLSGQHTERIARNAEELITRNRERAAEWRDRDAITVSIGVVDDRVRLTAQQLISEWEAQGHRVEVDRNPGGRSMSIQFERSEIKFQWYGGGDAVPGGDWYLLPSPELAGSLPPAAAFRWSSIGLAASIPDRDLVLARKARDNRYPLWDVPRFNRPLFVYAGPVNTELDWDFIQNIARTAPESSLLFFSTSEDEQQDPRTFIAEFPGLIYLGYKRPSEWRTYLSQASALLAPFKPGTNVHGNVADAMSLYLQAGKPVLATPIVARCGYGLAPGTTFAGEDCGEAVRSVLRAEADFELNDRYLDRIGMSGCARRIVKIAGARREANRERASISERPGPHILLETKTFHRGGLERVVLDMAQWMRAAGFPVSVAVAEDGGDMARECSALGFSMSELQNDPEVLKMLMTRDNIDLLIPHYSNFGADLAWRRGIPVLSVIHNSYIWADEKLTAQIRETDLFVSRYIAVSCSSKNFFSRRFGISAAKIEVIPNGIDVERCGRALAAPPRTTRATLGIGRREIVFLMVGSLIGTKAQLHAISAFSRLAQRRDDIRLIIVGPAYDARYAALLNQEIALLRLERSVRILPETNEIFDFYRLSDVFLSTSLAEGWSLAMTEAMFAGMPILTTEVGGAREAIGGHDLGIVVPPAYDDPFDLCDSNLWAYATERKPRNLDQLTAGLDELCDNLERWRRRAASGGDIVTARYSTTTVAQRYEREIERILLEHYGELVWKRPFARPHSDGSASAMLSSL